MKPINFLAAVVLLFVNCFAQSQTSWYKNYNGTIEKYPVTMHLHKAGHQYSGYYYYNSKQEPVYFIGDDTTEKEGIRLSSFVPDQETNENFVFSISGNTATGKWQTSKTKPLTFSAKETILPLSFDFIYTEGSVKLRPKMTESPAATYQAASVWPKGNSAQATFIKKMIYDAFEIKNPTGDIGKIFLNQKKQFFDSYLKDNKDLKDEDLQDPYSYNMDESEQLMIVYQSSKLLTLADYTYSYTGGAHGDYGTSFTSVNLINNKKLKLDDVIMAAGKKQLPKLLEKYFRKAYSLKENDPLTEGGLFENKIAANNNFYVTAKGIGFNYLPYEIASFAVGEVNVFIPFSELNNYLQPAFKKLIE